MSKEEAIKSGLSLLSEFDPAEQNEILLGMKGNLEAKRTEALEAAQADVAAAREKAKAIKEAMAGMRAKRSHKAVMD